MSIIRKLIILIIFVIFSFILYRLMATRRAIKAEYGIEGFREGAMFSSPTMDGELAAVKTSDVPAATTDTSDVYSTLPLKQCCIKGAYNAALTGYYVNTEMIKYVLYRGCRFLDFEIFSFDGDPYVAMSTDSTYKTIDTTNKLTLNEVLSTVVTYAFSAPSPISKDPLFIHLRIKTTNTDLYNKIAGVVRNILRPTDPSGNVIQGYRMYADDISGNALPVTGDTILKDIRNKIIVVLDGTLMPINYNTISPKLASLVNIESGDKVLQKYGYSFLAKQQATSPYVYKDGISTDISKMKMVLPDMTTSFLKKDENQIYPPMVLNYGAQIVLYKFNLVDQYLADYERAFANGKSAFVPIGAMVTYLNNKVGGDSSVKPAAIDVSGARVPPPVNPFASQPKSETSPPDLENVKRNLKDMVSSIFS